MRVRVEGPATSRLAPLVFIHGASGSATVWLELFRHFERSRRVVALDLPGHGQSGAWPEVADAQRIAQYRDAVGLACARLEIKRAILVGHSMGGLVALDAAAEYPDKVAGVVLLNAALGMSPDPSLLRALAERPAHQAELLGELGWSPTTSAEVVARWSRTVTSATPEQTLADLRAVAAFVAPSPERVRSQVLCIGGRDDLLCAPALVEQTAARLPHTETLLTDAGHYAHLEQAAIVISAIERFTTFV